MSTPEIDDLTAWAITAVPHDDDQSAQCWRAVLQEAWQEKSESRDWNALAQAILTTAESRGMWRMDCINDFLKVADDTGQGIDLIQRLVWLDSDLPQMYWRLGPMAWVRDGLDAHAERWFGVAWPTELMAYLNANLPEWQQWDEEYKAVWLADMFTHWEHPPPAEPGADAGDAEAIPSKDLEIAAAEAVAAVVVEIPGAEELLPEELAEIQAELVAEFMQVTTARGA